MSQPKGKVPLHIKFKEFQHPKVNDSIIQSSWKWKTLVNRVLQFSTFPSQDNIYNSCRSALWS